MTATTSDHHDPSLATVRRGRAVPVGDTSTPTGVGGSDRSHRTQTDSTVAMTTGPHVAPGRGSGGASTRLRTTHEKLSSHNIDF